MWQAAWPGLAVVETNQTFEVEGTVYSPSPRKLAAGELTLTMPAGWMQSAQGLKLGEVKPNGEARCSFRVRAPALAAAKRILPLVARYQNGSVKSTPATEMIWWGASRDED